MWHVYGRNSTAWRAGGSTGAATPPTAKHTGFAIYSARSRSFAWPGGNGTAGVPNLSGRRTPFQIFAQANAFVWGRRLQSGSTGGGMTTTTQATVFVPMRLLSGLWTQTDVNNQSGNLKAWLPPARQPIAYQQNGQWLMDPTWYRFLQYVSEIKLGGADSPTLTEVVSSVTTTAETAANAQTQVSAVIQQSQTNAESLQAVRQVVQGSSLSGSEQIPPVQLSPYESLP